MVRDSQRLEHAIAMWLDTVAVDDADTLVKKPTIVPELPVDAAGRHAIALLGELRTGTQRLRTIETIGQGGMGVVRLAEQVALGRRVAVKTLRPDRKSDQAAIDLLREAWVTGAVEHPNVVPVHDIGLDEDGSPVIVLKRIDGHSWAELIHDGDRVRERFRAEDLLTWNLEILIQVLHALRFAHSRGIVHRDLKPDNVMIGDFGEVYLLDWGIAVSLRDDPTGRLPLARDAHTMAGTPCYMAPEMLGGEDAKPITERTDVYLAGAVLYEILTGHPPHDGDNAHEVLTSVVQSNPAFPDDLPAELVVVCTRAMDADPDGRFEHAEQLRLALRGYLQHSGSARLAAQAERRLADLEVAVAAPDAATPAARQELYKLFGEARFGFHEALAGWKANASAKDGLTRAGMAMVGYELAHGDPRAAQALLGEIDAPPAALVARVADAVAAKRRREAELLELERAHDVRVGTRTRTFMAMFLGLFFTGLPVASALWPVARPSSPGDVAAWSGGFVVLIAAIGVWARDSMTRTLFNRRIFAMVMSNFVLQIVLAVAARIAGVGVEALGVLMLFQWLVTSVAIAIMLEHRLWPTSIGYLIGLLVATRWISLEHWMMAASNLVLTINAVSIWRPEALFPSPEERAAIRARGRRSA